MDGLLGLLFVASLIALVWGLIRPASFEPLFHENATRKVVGGIAGGILIVTVFAIGATASPTKPVASKTQPTPTPKTSTKPAAPSATATPKDSTPPSIVDTPTPQIDAAGGLAAAQQACNTYFSSISTIVQSSIANHDLAPSIRVTDGEPAGGGSVDPNAPYFTVTNSADTAASDDPKYQPIEDALNQLNTAVTQQDPFSNDFSTLANGAAGVSAACKGL